MRSMKSYKTFIRPLPTDFYSQYLCAEICLQELSNYAVLVRHNWSEINSNVKWPKPLLLIPMNSGRYYTDVWIKCKHLVGTYHDEYFGAEKLPIYDPEKRNKLYVFSAICTGR